MKKYILLPLLFLCSVAIAQQTYSFKSNWKKGQKFYFESVVDQNIDMDLGVNTVQTITTALTVYVKEVKPSGNMICTITYEKMQLKSSIMESMGIQDAIDKAMDQLFGLGYQVEVTPEGKCIGVTGASDMLRDYGVRMYPGNSPEDKFKRDEFIGKMTAQYNDSTLKAEFENISGSFTPDAPVKLNETWTRTTTTKLVVNKTTVNTYKLEAIDGNIATVSVVTTSKADGKMIFAGTDMAPDLNVEGSGTLKINLTTGLAETSTISMTANGTMENMGQKVNLNIVSKTTSSQKQVK
jgi:hypothetical protein